MHEEIVKEALRAALVLLGIVVVVALVGGFLLGLCF